MFVSDFVSAFVCSGNNSVGRGRGFDCCVSLAGVVIASATFDSGEFDGVDETLFDCVDVLNGFIDSRLGEFWVDDVA